MLLFVFIVLTEKDLIGILVFSDNYSNKCSLAGSPVERWVYQADIPTQHTHYFTKILMTSTTWYQPVHGTKSGGSKIHKIKEKSRQWFGKGGGIS